MNMIVPNYTPEDLQKLPLRAIVALSARCARRVEHRALVPDDQFLKGAVEDYEKLLRLDLGSYRQAGKPFDPSPDGPLGPLEPEDLAPKPSR